MQKNNTASVYADLVATQLRKGFLSFCVLKICRTTPVYTSDIVAALRDAELVVVEGTIYPLLNRLQRDGLLEYEWRESEQGPPRKYYKTTDYGNRVELLLQAEITKLTKTAREL